MELRSSHCGATGLAVSWERWDTGSRASPAQWVKDLGLTWLRLGSDPWSGNDICCVVAKKKKKKKKDGAEISQVRAALRPLRVPAGMEKWRHRCGCREAGGCGRQGGPLEPRGSIAPPSLESVLRARCVYCQRDPSVTVTF